MKRTFVALLAAVLIPVVYAGATRLLFDFNVLQGFTAVMSLSFLIGVPLAMGYLAIALSGEKQTAGVGYCLFAPWVSVFAFMGLSILFDMEGFACWIMVLPIFLIVSSIGGLIARAVKRGKSRRSQKLQGTVVLFLPLLMSPLEKLIPAETTRYEAYTYADIHASRSNIWHHVTRVSTIAEEEDHGYLTRWLGFPRPIRAELNYSGVGGSRQAMFSKGLVFNETVRQFEDLRMMRFTIKVDPAAIRPSAMDKHVVIGGAYFDVLDGTYLLEKTNDSTCRLHLYSHFTLRTTFNGYAAWWAGLIMKDIQNNILGIIKTRCELHL
ncbi:MAG TPA: hypothetical protein VHE54_16075 [Puia sp.]|nr:hypothetical protein [Puia sp.]